MANEREGKGREQKGGEKKEGPYIGAADRPDLAIDLDARVGDMTVRQLSSILGQNQGIIWKIPKDLKDGLKDHKDLKDIIDTGSPIFKEIIDVVRIQKPFEGPDPGPLGGGLAGLSGMAGMGGASSPLDQLIERISGLERSIERLERREPKS